MWKATRSTCAYNGLLRRLQPITVALMPQQQQRSFSIIEAEGRAWDEAFGLECMHARLRAKLIRALLLLHACTSARREDRVRVCARSASVRSRKETRQTDGAWFLLVSCVHGRNAAECGLTQVRVPVHVRYGARKCANRSRCRRNANLMRLTDNLRARPR